VKFEENTEHIIKLSYKILETSNIDENVNILAKLKVKNTSSEPVYMGLKLLSFLQIILLLILTRFILDA